MPLPPRRRRRRGRLRRFLRHVPIIGPAYNAYRRRRRMTFVLILLFAHLLGALTSIDAIMDTRTSQGAVAWAVSLNTFPWVAVPAYWIFGRAKFEGYVLERRQEVAKTNPVARKLVEDLKAEGAPVSPDHEKAVLLERLAKLPFTRHNDAELLIDAEATYAAIFKAIEEAKDYVLVQFYIIKDDNTGRRLMDALIARAKTGVRCYLLYDEIGSHLPAEFTKPMSDAGVNVRRFNTTQGTANRFQLNFRNHRKIVIADGKVALLGGLNIGDEHLGLDPKIGKWRDTHVMLRGPVVPCVQVSFIEDWQWAAKEIPKDLNWNVEPAPGGADKIALCLPSGPADELETNTLFFLSAINAARQRIWIASPYFVPDEQFVSALQLAALRGVDVRIIVPKEPDNPMVKLAAYSYLPELEKAGVKTFRYVGAFMHQKVVLVDDKYSSVGTANFDNRSFRLNFEITAVIADESFAKQVETMLTNDLSKCETASAKDLTDASFGFRFAVRVARLTAPVQ